jgi:hypothetical protein
MSSSSILMTDEMFIKITTKTPSLKCKKQIHQTIAFVERFIRLSLSPFRNVKLIKPQHFMP